MHLFLNGSISNAQIQRTIWDHLKMLELLAQTPETEV